MNSSGFCDECGRISGQLQAMLCPTCYEAERSDYWKIRQYLSKKPYANAIEIASETNISISKITSYIKGDALSFRS
ncbi:winged helix-turn-helix domain-containing protein [Bacillus tianshenii]|nr:winged helix-turn-helix domain-containing protein [Bacillus tianshenii]